MSVVGFDFGNLNCVICQAKRGGIDTVLNSSSKRLTQNAVSFVGKERFVGEKAVPTMSSNFKNTVVELKRFIGKSWSDPQVQKDLERLPNKAFVQELEGDRIGFKVQYDNHPIVLSAEELAAMMLGHLKQTAEAANGGKLVTDCVISVPACFTDRQRRAVVDAAKIAKLNALRLINDNTATALAYGIWRSARNVFDDKEKQYVMFVNVGQAHYEVSVVSYVQGKLEVVATAWDANFGGRNVDDVLVNHFADEFQAKYKMDPRTNPKSMIKLRKECEKAKITLTPEGVTQANLNVEFLMEETDFRSILKLDDFNTMVASFKEKIAAPIDQVLKEANITPEQIGSVEIVGGGSRPRFVKQLVSDLLKLDKSKPNYGLSTTLNADESVARGCALNCAMLSPAFRVKEFAVVDTCSYPIRISWEQQEAAAPAEEQQEDEDDGAETAQATAGTNHIVLFKRNDKMPNTRRVTFVRNKPINIVAEYDETAELPEGVERKIGSFTVKGMPADGEKAPTVRVNFRVNIDGVFVVNSSEYLVEIEEKEPVAPPAEEGDNKDGEAAAEGENKEAEPEKKRKRKFKKVSLQVDSAVSSMDSTQLMNSTSREEEFANQDRIIRETSEARNALEEYIYRMRDRLDGELKEFSENDEREALKKALSESEDWLYDDGSDQPKQVYVDRLNGHRSFGDKYDARKTEAEERPAAFREFGEAMEKLLRVANSTEEKYSHLTDEERTKVRDACNGGNSWLTEMQSAQADALLSVDPVVSCAQVREKAATIERECSPIVNKRKPAPKKEEKVPEEKKEAEADASMEAEAPADGEAKEEANKEDMDLD